MLINPLVLPVLSILKSSDKLLSLYQLMQILEKSGYDLYDSLVEKSDEVKLFRKNFIVMNALYQINSDIRGTGYRLCISSLNIRLIAEGAEQALLAEDVSTDVALSEYYLDWENYNSTDKADVEALLSSFWIHFAEYQNQQNGNDKRLDSLQVLGLESSASWKDIQQAYRQLVNIYHPDKGGNSLKFIQVRQAFLILKLMHNFSH